MVIKLFIGSDKLDLFKDENINLNSSIADVSDITKNTTDFTKSFTVPASDNNNNIFKHYYDANIDGGFDARVKVSGSIELDGIPFKIGKWRLNKVKIKNGIADSYNVNFWGNLVTLKDLLKNDELSGLDLSAYNHNYTPENIKTGLTTSLFSGDIIYNLLAKKQYYYSSNPTDNVQEETFANIAFGGGIDTGVIWNDLRPSIKLIRLIEAIETKYSITFSRDYFGRSEFTELFMYLDNDNESLKNTFQVEFDNVGDINTSGNILNLATNTFKDSNSENIYVYLKITPSVGYEDVEYRTQRFINGSPKSQSKIKTGYSSTKLLTSGRNNEHTYFIISNESFKFTVEFQTEVLVNYTPFETIRYTALQSEQTYELIVEPSNLIPKLKVIDFLKGLFSKDKLVIIPKDDGSIYVNTLDEYYAEGNLINVTEYVDTNNFEVSRGDILNEIFFKFKEPETILNNEFKNNTGNYYGDSETYLYDDNGEQLLDGESLEVELPFEQVVYERLNDDFDGLETNVQYGALIDDSLSPVNIDAHIFYNINTNISSKKVGFIDISGTKTELGNTINTPSHVNTNDFQTFSTVFSTELNEFTGEVIENTLYSNNYEDYILSIFNIKRRNFNFKSKNFPLILLTELSLNDVLQIKDNYYRIDNYNLNLLTGDIDFKLINSFDNAIKGFSSDRSVINTDSIAKTESIYVANLSNYTSAKNDTGDGVGWVTVSSSGNNIYFAFTENTLTIPRSMTVTITNDDTLQDFTVTLNQLGSGLTWDNNIITLDNNNITWDNNI